MPRTPTTSVSRRRLEGFTRDQLFSEIHSITSTPHLGVSWGSIFSGLLAAPVLDDLSDLQHLLEDISNDELIDYALALGTASESAHESATMQSTRKTRRTRKTQRSSSAIRVTTSEDWLRARERRTHKTLQSSRRNEAQRKPLDDDAFRHKLQDAEDRAAKNRSEIEALRAKLQNSEQEREKYEQQLWASKVELHQIATVQEKTNTDLIGLRQQMKAQEVALGRLQTDLNRAVETETFNQNALHETRIEMRQKEMALATVLETLQSCETQRDELRVQRDELETALRSAENERKSAQYQLMDDSDAVPRQQSSFSDAPGGVCADAITYWTDDAFARSSRSLSSYQSAEGSSSLLSGRISEDVQSVQVQEGPEHPTCVTTSHETDGDRISTPAELPPRCCDQTPVARTNAGCELCPDHCEQFTWFSPAEMGIRPCTMVTTCPACNGPRCESAELSSYYWTN